MDEKQLLQSFGLTEYEIKVYLALAQLSSGTASEIAQLSRVPSNKVYASLIHLIEKGFIASLPIKPKQYKVMGIQPFRVVLEEKEKKFKELEKGIASLQTLFQKKQKSLQDVALVLKGKDKILNMLAEATEDTQKFAYSFVGNLHFDYHTAKPVVAAIKRGVDVRFLAHKDTAHKHIYRQWQKLGVKIKYYPKEEQKSIRFSTFDGKVCRITIGEPEIKRQEDYLSFWIESPAFASLLRDQFESMWKKAEYRELR